MKRPFTVGLLTLAVAWAAAQAPAVATLQGKDVSLSGGDAALNAQGRLDVPSGSEINLTGKTAQLTLARGGAIRLCGPARMSLSAGGDGALLLSLSAGGLELRFPTGAADTLLTPDYRVTAVIPPGQLAAVSASAALDAAGKLCLLNRGSALSVQQLWSGQQEYVINGQAVEFAPDGGMQAVASCPCAAAAPAPVAAPADNPSAGAPPLLQSAPALVVDGATPPTEVSGAPTVIGSPASPPQPARGKQRNIFSRFLHWLF